MRIKWLSILLGMELMLGAWGVLNANQLMVVTEVNNNKPSQKVSCQCQGKQSEKSRQSKSTAQCPCTDDVMSSDEEFNECSCSANG